MPANTRPALAVATALFLVASAAAYWGLQSDVATGVALRTAFLSGALWLAWPEMTQRSLRNVAVIGVGVLILLFRPRTAWVVIPVLLIWAGTKRKK
jgi:hypothetical protein